MNAVVVSFVVLPEMAAEVEVSVASAVASGVGGPGGNIKIKTNTSVGAVKATRKIVAASVDGYSGAHAQLVRPITQCRCQGSVVVA